GMRVPQTRSAPETPINYLTQAIAKAKPQKKGLSFGRSNSRDIGRERALTERTTLDRSNVPSVSEPIRPVVRADPPRYPRKQHLQRAAFRRPLARQIISRIARLQALPAGGQKCSPMIHG